MLGRNPNARRRFVWWFQSIFVDVGINAVSPRPIRGGEFQRRQVKRNKTIHYRTSVQMSVVRFGGDWGIWRYYCFPPLSMLHVLDRHPAIRFKLIFSCTTHRYGICALGGRWPDLTPT